MAISLNSKQNIGFTGLKQNIEQSRQIVARVRKEYGRPHSNSYLKAKIYQHIDNDDKTDLLIRLCSVKDKYNSEVFKVRNKVDKWVKLHQVVSKIRESVFKKQSKGINLHDYIRKMKREVLKVGAANCAEMSYIVQYEHFVKGVFTHNVAITFYDKSEPILKDNHTRSHCFSIRGLAKGAYLDEPHTWGQNAVIVDSWIGTGIVEKAFDTPIPTYKNGEKVRGEFIQGGLSKILDFFKFNPDTEKLRFFEDNLKYSREFIENMHAKGK